MTPLDTARTARALLGRLAPVGVTALVAAAFVAPSLAIPVLTAHLTDGVGPATLTLDPPAGTSVGAVAGPAAAPVGPGTARLALVSARRGFTDRGGHPLTSTSRGAWARWTVIGAPGATVTLRAAVGPDHGRLKVTIDGTVVDVVDTWRSRSGTATVWRRTLVPGLHTIVVANLGTTGRAIVAVDALLVG